MSKNIKTKNDAQPPVVDFEKQKVADMTDEEKQQLFATTNYSLINDLVFDVVPCTMNKLVFDQEKLDDAEVKTKNLMTSILTGNGLETMLAAQMVTTHSLQMKAATYAKHQTNAKFITPYVNMVTKLSNTFIQQTQLLMKLQGKGEQKVTVEHVNVHEGGQAIVGNVINNQGDEK